MEEFVKCLVWDLDNTIWKGTLLEKDECSLRPGIIKILNTLDSRGILHSIASANDQDTGLAQLKKLGIADYFLCPQIQWSNKILSLQKISKQLKISLGSLGFIDDEPFELEQVRQILPWVRTYPTSAYRSLLGRPEFNPPFLTKESRLRRRMYVQESQKDGAYQKAGGSFKEFLKFCQTQILLRPARKSDLPRILELMHRTHQLNATGEVCEAKDITAALEDPRFRVYVSELKDHFQDYGRVGVAICRVYRDRWRLDCFLMSCRILGRGLGGIFLGWLQHEALKSGVGIFEARYRERERNRRMYMLFRLTGFGIIRSSKNGTLLLSKTCGNSLKVPPWLTLREEGRR